MNIDLFKVVEIFKDDFPDTKLVKSIMMDLYPDEKAEMNLLCNIYNTGYVKKLVKSSASEKNIDAAIKSINAETFISEDMIRIALNKWLKVYLNIPDVENNVECLREKSEKGDSKSQYKLGKLLYEESIKWITESKKNGNLEAVKFLENMFKVKTKEKKQNLCNDTLLSTIPDEEMSIYHYNNDGEYVRYYEKITLPVNGERFAMLFHLDGRGIICYLQNGQPDIILAKVQLNNEGVMVYRRPTLDENNKFKENFASTFAILSVLMGK